MVTRVLIIGGYGNFGSYIAKSLADDPEITLLIGGRSRDKANAFIATLETANPAEAHSLDIFGDVDGALKDSAPDIVIHTTGPFQAQGYQVAQACIRSGCHYIDLADARAFVSNITRLDVIAQAQKVLVVSGASSVPCLTAALVDDYLPHYRDLQDLDYGISAAQQTNRGLATASSILSYVGKPFTSLRRGKIQNIYGWQGLHSEIYPGLGTRLFGDCDIPDLTLFPARYPTLHSIRFCAGHEIKLLHLATWLLSWLVRLGLAPSLSKHAERLLQLSFLFDPLGSSESGFHMFLRGVGLDGRQREDRFYLIARSGHGPYIPCMPAILLARKLARDTLSQRGATPCVDLIPLAEYVDALEGLDITITRETKNG